MAGLFCVRTGRTWGAGGLALGAVWLCAGSAASADAVKVPTFAKDVAPIFQAKCEACHRADSMAPMSLVTYQ
jgi:hypothetical protein